MPSTWASAPSSSGAVLAPVHRPILKPWRCHPNPRYWPETQPVLMKRQTWCGHGAGEKVGVQHPIGQGHEQTPQKEKGHPPGERMALWTKPRMLAFVPYKLRVNPYKCGPASPYPQITPLCG